MLDTGEFDSALALGVQPIAATRAYQQDQLPAYLPLQGEIPVNLGTVQEPDLEQILRLKPDLILGSQLRHGRLYPLLSKIAPTVFSVSIGASWADNLQLFGTALNRSQATSQWLSSYQQQCHRVAQLYRDKGQPRISVVRSMQSHVRLYLADSFIGSILRDCGLQRPLSQQASGFALRLRAPNHIKQLNGELILLSEYAPQQGSMIRRWQRSGFWLLLSGKVVSVDDSYWMLGIGPHAAQQVLSDLESILNGY